MVMRNQIEQRKEITKPHSIIMAKMKLSAKEQDLLSLLIMKVKGASDSLKVEHGVFDPIKPESLDKIPTIFDIHVSELSRIFGMSARSIVKRKRNAKTGELELSALEKACQSIRDQDIMIRSESSWQGRRLVSDAMFVDGILTLETTRTMAAIMLDFGVKNNSFGMMDMSLYFGLGGAYEKRLLEFISRFKNQNDFKITLSEFCDIIGATPSDYKTMAIFRRNTLEKPLARLIRESDGMWVSQEDHPKGFFLKRGAKANDLITFKMQYNNLNVVDEAITEDVAYPIAIAFETQIKAGVFAVIEMYLGYITSNNLVVPEDVQEIIMAKNEPILDSRKELHREALIIEAFYLTSNAS